MPDFSGSRSFGWSLVSSSLLLRGQICPHQVAGFRGSTEPGASAVLPADPRRQSMSTPPVVWLKANCGRGDWGEPVITVMLPEDH
jgi:hypothetical protein